MRRWMGSLLGAVLMVGGLAACGSSAKKSAAAITVTAKEESPTKYSFDIPPLKAGRVDLTLVNSGKTPHDLQLFRVDKGTTDEQIKKEFLDTIDQEGSPIPSWFHAAGGVGTVAPGKTGKAQVELAKGDYGFFCTESDDESSGAPAGSHVSKGMYGRFSVTAKDNEANLATTAATVDAKEYTFNPSGLKSGTNDVTFRNIGHELHHFVIAPLAAGKTIDDVKSFIATQGPPQGPPPLDFEKATSVAVVEPGEAEVASVTLPSAGKYVMMCFINDRAGGPPHATKGMIAEVDIS